MTDDGQRVITIVHELWAMLKFLCTGTVTWHRGMTIIPLMKFVLTSWIDSRNRYVKQYLLFATLPLSFSIRRSHLLGVVSSCKTPIWKSLNSPQNFALSTVSAVLNSFFLNMNVRWKIGINASNIQILVLLRWEYHWFQYLKHSLLLYIQLSFSIYLTCKWKGAVSYDTLPGTGFTGSGTIFSLVTTAGKFNRERRFWSHYEVFQILRQICYSVLLARYCVSFITAGQRNRYDFLCLIRLPSIQNHGPRSILVRKAWVKWSFGFWFYLPK